MQSLIARLTAPFAGRRRNRPVLDALYTEIMAAARQPDLYARLGVPDTVEGRYDMVMLHTYLVIDRLRGTGEVGQALAQDLFDHMFRDMDQALREMGVGDMGIGKRIQKMASQFYGRAAAYDAGLTGTDADLEDAVARNAYAGIAPPEGGPAGLAIHMRRVHSDLAAIPLEEVLAGQISMRPREPA